MQLLDLFFVYLLDDVYPYQSRINDNEVTLNSGEGVDLWIFIEAGFIHY
jgi:hypothetical protein